MQQSRELDLETIAPLLHTSGYTYSEIILVAKELYAADPSTATLALKHSGAMLDDTIDLLVAHNQMNLEESLSLLKSNGILAGEMAFYLKQRHQKNAEQVAALLEGADYSIDEIGLALELNLASS